MNYQAVILAAGRGSRLKDYSKDKPKPLLEVNGKPIIDYQLESLKNNNVNNVIIVIGYKNKVLKNYLNAKWSKQINITYIKNEIYFKTNSAYSLFLARNMIKSDFYFHLNCDTIFSDNILFELINSSYQNQIVINNSLELCDNMEQVRLDRNGKIIKMDNKYDVNAIGKAMGLAKISCKSLSNIIDIIENYHKSKNYMNNFYGIIRECLFNHDFYSLILKGDLIVDINNTAELKIAEKEIKNYYRAN